MEKSKQVWGKLVSVQKVKQLTSDCTQRVKNQNEETKDQRLRMVWIS